MVISVWIFKKGTCAYVPFLGTIFIYFRRFLNFETFWIKKSHFYKSKCKRCHQLLFFSWLCKSACITNCDVCGGDQDISAEVMVPQQFTACICNAIDGFNGLRTAIASFFTGAIQLELNDRKWQHWMGHD